MSNFEAHLPAGKQPYYYTARNIDTGETAEVVTIGPAFAKEFAA